MAHGGGLLAQVSQGMFAKTTGKIEDRWQAFMTYQIHRTRYTKRFPSPSAQVLQHPVTAMFLERLVGSHQGGTCSCT